MTLLTLCTAFLLSDGEHFLVGKSYDWDVGEGLVITNRRGVAKQTLPLKGNETPAQWVSKYASVTFNQYGRELPNGGMNERGLVVEILWLKESVYPPSDARPVVNELQWIQYQLDNFSNVAEMQAEAEKIRVQPAYANVHYFACDRERHCAAIEFLDGKLRFSAADDPPVLTNNTYSESLAALKKASGTPKGTASLARFVRTAHARATRQGSLPESGWAMLSDVSQGKHSKWNLLYDPAQLTIQLRTLKNRKPRTISLAPKTCDAPVEAMSVDSAGPLAPYRSEMNRALVARTVKALGKFPPSMIEKLAMFPEQLSCTVK